MTTADLDLRRESLLSVSANVFVVALKFVTMVVLTRVLSPSGLGLYFFTLAIAHLLARPSIGVGGIVRKRASETDAPRRELFGVWVCVTGVWVGFLTVGVSLAAPLLVAQTPLSASGIPVLIAVTLALAAVNFATRFYDGLGRPGASMWVQAIRDVAFLGVILGVAAVGGDGFLLLIAYTGLQLVVASGLLLWIRLPPWLPSRATLHHAYTYGVWSLPEEILGSLLRRLPTAVLGFLIGSTAVGLYEGAAELTLIGSYMATCINDPLLVKVSGKTSRGDAVGQDITTALSYTPLFAVPVLGVVLALGESVLAVAYTPAYTAATGALIAFAVGRVLYGLSSPLSSAMRGADKPRLVFWTKVGRLFVALPLLVGLTHAYGVLGTATVFVVDQLVALLLLSWLGRRTFPTLTVPPLLGHLAVAGGVAYVVARGIAAVAPLAHDLTVIVAATGGVSAYLVSLLVTSHEVRHGATALLRAARVPNIK